MKRFVQVAVALVIVIAGIFAAQRIPAYLQRREAIQQQQNVVIPPPERSSSSKISQPSVASISSVASSISSELRTEVNLDVPFTPQAPTANWDAVHQEACEEASVLMVLKYFQGESIDSPQDAEAGIQEVLAKNEELGFPIDTTAEQIVTLIHALDPSLTATLLKNPTADAVKKELSRGALLIVPAAGRQLGNPYFSGAGPLYHMLVIRGYTKDGYVITNDPGTKRGEAYVYTWDTLLAATHDWNNGDPANGEKVMVVVSR